MSIIEQELIFLENILSGKLGNNDFSNLSDLKDLVSKEALDLFREKYHKDGIGGIN